MNPLLMPDPTTAFPEHAPRRVVSLVPSATGSLVDLGLTANLVGCSDFCELPEGLADRVERVGGPKTLDTGKIVGLSPDLVIANREENSREEVEALAEAGLTVWLAFPLTVQEAINDLWVMANLFRSEGAMRQVDMLERAMEWARHAGEGAEPARYFCPIWQDALPGGTPWWMAFNHRTYSDDLLAVFHGENIFAGRDRRYPLEADLGQIAAELPGERDTRYPRVTQEEVLEAQPEVILLPGEPYPYGEEEASYIMEIFAGTPAVRDGRVYLIDGSLITWPGTRMARALEELGEIFS